MQQLLTGVGVGRGLLRLPVCANSKHAMSESCSGRECTVDFVSSYMKVHI